MVKGVVEEVEEGPGPGAALGSKYISPYTLNLVKGRNAYITAYCDWYIFLWVSGFVYRVSQKCRLLMKSSISDERARKARKSKF